MLGYIVLKTGRNPDYYDAIFDRVKIIRDVSSEEHISKSEKKLLCECSDWPEEEQEWNPIIEKGCLRDWFRFEKP